MANMVDTKGEFSLDPPAINMTDKDLKLDESDMFALDTNYALDSYGPKSAANVKMCPGTEYWQEKMSNVADKIVNEL